jgi:group I intron endonuclease
MNGIIYKYTSPSGKVYIGQTLDAERRRREFLDINIVYAGARIENARKKYLPESFTYEILESKEYDNINDALTDLNRLESYYIGKYDSYHNGYNMTYGGEGVRGIVFSEETKQKISNTLKKRYKTNPNPFKGKKHTQETKDKLSEIASKRKYSPTKGKHWSEKQRQFMSELGKLNVGDKNPFYGKKHSEKTKETISKANSVPVLQIDPKTNEIIQRFDSAKQAGDFFGKPRANSEIIKVCRQYVSPSGKKYLTALGFKWEYEDKNKFEGSTTTETTEM